jgi:CheY-like chemotaxis protein
MDDLPYKTTFLVLEDDADDAILIRRSFTNSACQAFVCRNTSEARAYLMGAGMYVDRNRFPFPDIIVTDLRLGEDSGINFIKWVRSRPELEDMPVIVLSGSASPSDIRAARELAVDHILDKPGDPADLQKLVLKVAAQLCLSGGAAFQTAFKRLGQKPFSL